MDAQVAYGFHHLRNERPYLAQSPITNKVSYIFQPFISFLQNQITELVFDS